MKNPNAIFCVLLAATNSALISANLGNDTDDLLAVVVYFRHGDRTPVSSFPTDEYFTPSNFPMGLGQLTNKGLSRHYDLGGWFRARYASFLPDRYSPGDIYVRATDVDRTLMSAAANLAALYPPKAEEVWNEDLPWRPIPIHTVPKSEDSVLAMQKQCPRYEELYAEIQSSTFYKQMNEEHAELYEYLSRHSGFNVTDVSGVKTLRSIFYVYRSYNSSYVPAWASSLDQTVLDYLSGLSYQRYTFTAAMKRLRAGPFFDYLVTYFEGVKSLGTPKFLMLSSHDTELASVLDAMGAYDLYPPGFAASIIWELRRSASTGVDYVRAMYRKSESELVELLVNGCEFDCPYERFKEVLGPVTVGASAWEEECLGVGDGTSDMFSD